MKEYETNIVPLEGSQYGQRRYTCPDQTEMAEVKRAVTAISKGVTDVSIRMDRGKDHSMDKAVDDNSSLSVTVEVKVKVSMANQMVDQQETPLRHTLSFKTALAKKVNNNFKDKEEAETLAEDLTEQQIEFVGRSLSKDRQDGESATIVQQIISTLLTDAVNCNTDHFIIATDENVSVDSDKNNVHDPVELNLNKSDFQQDLRSENGSQQTPLEFEDGAGTQSEIEIEDEAPLGQIPTAFLLLREPVATPERQSWDERIIFPMEHEVKGVSLWSVGTGGCVGVDYRFPTPTGRETEGRQVRFAGPEI